MRESMRRDEKVEKYIRFFILFGIREIGEKKKRKKH